MAVPIGTALVVALIPSSIRQLIINYKEAMRLLGARRAAIGSLLLCLLRLRLPRRDLFLQAPVISWVPWIALSIVLYSTISLPVLKWALPLALTVLMLAMGLDMIAPPIWLFLGTSEYDSFVAFHVLRNCWRKCGVTLLNRSNPEGGAFYVVQRRSLPLKSLFLDPTAQRVWSLRTRSNMWRNSVLLLMDHVLVVIVDVRGDSRVVRDELDWLRERGLMNKAWFLASDGERVSDEDMEAIASRYPQIETSSTRVAGLAALSDAAWSRSGLALADFSRKIGKRL